MADGRERKRVKLTEENEPEQKSIKKMKRSKEEKTARKLERKVKRTMKVVSKVFGIPELHDFAATIDTAKVRRALWLEPASAARLRWEEYPKEPGKSRARDDGQGQGKWMVEGKVGSQDGLNPIVNPFVPVNVESHCHVPRSNKTRAFLVAHEPYSHEQYYWVDRDIADVHKAFLKLTAPSQMTRSRVLIPRPISMPISVRLSPVAASTWQEDVRIIREQETHGKVLMLPSLTSNVPGRRVQQVGAKLELRSPVVQLDDVPPFRQWLP
ncbi:hypothetical protein LTR27_005603 [Elasticomyces elasticus]|nr:hypothetical protein LTR27_005603 [Elasticomyces elasticus]